MKNSYAPVWTDVLDSSVAMEPLHVRWLWIAMLTLQEADHVVRYDSFKLARRANLTEKEVIDGLKVLSSPDKRRLEPQEHEGRRILRRDDGWFLVNGKKYQDRARELNERVRKAKWIAAKRAKDAQGGAEEPDPRLR
jgi:hypothetical protein